MRFRFLNLILFSSTCFIFFQTRSGSIASRFTLDVSKGVSDLSERIVPSFLRSNVSLNLEKELVSMLTSSLLSITSSKSITYESSATYWSIITSSSINTQLNRHAIPFLVGALFFITSSETVSVMYAFSGIGLSGA